MTPPRPYSPPDPAAYAKRLAIVVPYRDRAEHLARFLPHMLAYFERDKLDRAIDYSIHIAEQLDDAPFNRGAMKNAGFLIAREAADYVCFHDVDYLPVWADYSYVTKPTRLVWHGLDPATDYQAFLGAVVAFNRADFERINGYSNDYRGWGYEDDDLRTRCQWAGLELAFRDGTYTRLPHVSHGFGETPEYTPEASANARIFTDKLLAGRDGFSREGLSTLGYELVETATWVRNGEPQRHIRHHRIRLR